jgi:trigger factor
MNVNVIETGPVNRTLEISIPKDRVTAEIEKAMNHLAKTVKLPGFRQGKVPRDIVVKQFGASARQEAIEHLVPEVTLEALGQSKVEGLGRPRIEGLNLAEDLTLTFRANVEIKPAFELKPGFDKLKLKAPKVDAGDVAVENELKRLAEQYATLGPILDRPAKKGDVLFIDYVAKDGDVSLEGGRAQRQPVELGAGQSLPGFEDALEGMAAGGKKDVQVPFPGDHPDARLRGKSIRFVVHVHEVHEKQLPALDDALAKQLGPFESLEALKAKIAEAIQVEGQNRRKAALTEQVGEQLVAMHEVAAPQIMVDAECDMLIDRERQELKRRGMAFRDDAANIQALRLELKPQAERRSRLTLILEKVAEQKKLQVEDADYRAEMGRFAQSMRMQQDQMLAWARETGREEGIKARLLNDKAMDWLISQSEVKED